MSAVEMNDQEWGVLMSILSDAPWKVANPLLMKIGEQLRAQTLAKMQPTDPAGVPGNGREVRHE
jgi:flagellar motility protein MotE (MotC chaperone)